ncbi:MAG: hypothetical protein ACEPOV_14365 [Hyphomicrobiales bacterium]
MKKNLSLYLIACLAIFLTSCCSYNSTMKNALKKTFGDDFKDYYAFSYPTNNFGIFTSYEEELSDKNQYCAMTSCLKGIEIKTKKDWLDIDGLADIGKGSPISLSESKKTKIATEAVLPNLWKTLDIGAKVSNNRIVNTKLITGPAYIRHINKMKFEDYLDSLPNSSRYKRKYNAGEFVIIVSDVIIEYLAVRIEVNNEFASEIDTKLNSGNLNKNIGDLGLSANLSKVSTGVYEYKIDHPVIVLRLAMKPKISNDMKRLIDATSKITGGNKGNDNTFGDWEVVKPVKEKRK